MTIQDSTLPAHPFHLAIDQAVLDDLHERLVRTRWPERETVGDGSQGYKLADAQTVWRYWKDHYDWRRCERMLNGMGQHHATIDGLDIHFLHVRSPEPDAIPLLMTHGWPGSVIEFHKVIGPLTNPAAHGGDPADAFHLIAPSLPGFGFSAKPEVTGWTIRRIADAWITLMRQLGYDRYVAQGGDWGAIITTLLGGMAPPGLAAIHLSAVLAHPTREDLASLTDQERQALEDWAALQASGTGYSAIQSTRPQTLGYGLTDSPMGQAAWILEKFADHTDCDGDLLSLLSLDELIDNVMLYWLNGNATSSARLYWESFGHIAKLGEVAVPTGCTLFPREVVKPARRWAERRYRNIVYWNEAKRGGHFAAFEQPDLFVEEMRACFRQFRAPVATQGR